MTVPWSNRASAYTEVSLHGQLSEGRHDHFCRILAGLTAMPPQRLIERHLIFSPVRGPQQQASQVGGTQNIQDAAKRAVQRSKGDSGDVHYLQVVETLPPEWSAGRDTASAQSAQERSGVDSDELKVPTDFHRAWSLRLYGLPEAGKRVATIRSIVTDDVHVDAATFMQGIGYSFLSEHVLAGEQFFQNNTVLTLHRILRCPGRRPSETSAEKGRALNVSPSLSECSLLDESGTYVLEAKIRVQDGKNPESMSRATQELLAFKERMRGIIDLRTVDRLSLDTRVKSVARAA